MEGEEQRFSDKELVQLRKDLMNHKLLQEERYDQQQEQLGSILNAVESNTKSVSDLAKSTAGVVQLYEDIQGAARVGVSIQNFCLWLAKWGAIGTGLTAAIFYVIDHFKH